MAKAAAGEGDDEGVPAPAADGTGAPPDLQRSNADGKRRAGSPVLPAPPPLTRPLKHPPPPGSISFVSIEDQPTQAPGDPTFELPVDSSERKSIERLSDFTQDHILQHRQELIATQHKFFHVADSKSESRVEFEAALHQAAAGMSAGIDGSVRKMLAQHDPHSQGMVSALYEKGAQCVATPPTQLSQPTPSLA